ncbi:HD family phosphohydrolase [Anaerocolumna cellulosilytica]|jgi:3'-5' exoribonuclease|uniref:HD family phosphohydrolase n=1 Tax=Anaerocolumna cellulosilytica TaxID=433286 RepID=A0A6S6QZ38_9FIRM|nr:HD domain-containing protein [Anaerocolumna cellulosilytica]MBB5196935.1 3'-5' exoribonuclease [Anaerocolumna cellulosilytica]BCJ92665.1 HD family phosphohydrolase [Anaerocolumna cellulosilytica]
MRYIGELRDGEMVSETYLCKTKQTLKTKAGKNYYSMLLQDKSGTLDAKIWELSSGIDHFEAMEYIRVDGQVVSFQGSLQLNVKRVRRSQEGEYDPADFVPTTAKNVEQMYSDLLKYIAKFQQPHLKRLAESFFADDKDFALRFKKHSAAKSVHHGFVGGLLEHTLGVVNLCDYYANNYPILNRDLLLCAAMFHDVGKMEELSTFPENDYTDDGQLLGHIYIGAEIIGARIRTIQGFPPQLAAQLKHCILAHHGELEYGSPKKPAIIEALALNFADNTDAKIQTMTELLNSGDEKATWLGLSRLFESNIRRTTF